MSGPRAYRHGDRGLGSDDAPLRSPYGWAASASGDSTMPSPHSVKVGGGLDYGADPGSTTSSRYRPQLSPSGTLTYSGQPKLRTLRSRVPPDDNFVDRPRASDLTFQSMQHLPRSLDSRRLPEGYDSRYSIPQVLNLHYDYSREELQPPMQASSTAYYGGTYARRRPDDEAPLLLRDRPSGPRAASRSPSASARADPTGGALLPRRKLPLVPRVAGLAQKTPQAPGLRARRPVSGGDDLDYDDALRPQETPGGYIPPYSRYADKNSERFSDRPQGSRISTRHGESEPNYSDYLAKPPYTDPYDTRPTKTKRALPSGYPDATPPSVGYRRDVDSPSKAFPQSDDSFLGKPRDWRSTTPTYEDQPRSKRDRYPTATFDDVAARKKYDIDLDDDKLAVEGRKVDTYNTTVDPYDIDEGDDFPRYSKEYPQDREDEGEGYDDYRPNPTASYSSDYQAPPSATTAAAASTPSGPLKYGLLALVALLALYGLTRAFGWVRGRAAGRLDCGRFEFAACREEGCAYDPDRRSCFLPSPHEIVREAGFKTPYRILFVGSRSADTRTCINSMVKAYGAGSYLPRPFDLRDSHQVTKLDQLHLYDTPPMDLTTDLDAFYKVRKFVGGVELNQNFTRHPFAWVNDKAQAASRVALVLDIRPAIRGWVWHSVKQSGIAYFVAQLEKVDTALPVTPLVIINTMGYKPRTAAKVRDALKRAYRLDYASVHAVDCSYIRPLDLSKMLYNVFLDNKYTSIKLDSFTI